VAGVVGPAQPLGMGQLVTGAEEVARFNAVPVSQATDVLGAAIARCAADDILGNELRFRLANVLFLPGSYGTAVAEFEMAGNRFAEHYGPDDSAALGCRYYAATCKAAIGENTEALAAFRAFLSDWSAVAGDGDERTLDVRRRISLLLASIGRPPRRSTHVPGRTASRPGCHIRRRLPRSRRRHHTADSSQTRRLQQDCSGPTPTSTPSQSRLWPTRRDRADDWVSRAQVDICGLALAGNALLGSV
jgi:hypothetical protein